MPTADLFRRFGLFAADGFFDAGLCRDLRQALRSGARNLTTVGTKGADYVVDPSYRSAKWVHVEDALMTTVREKLHGVMPALTAHYGIELTDVQSPQFLVYGPGDHYKAHRDSRKQEEAAGFARARRISSVIFLNSESADETPETFSGGALTFFDLVEAPDDKSVGIPLQSEEGLLITFPSEMLHSVAPVTRGERYTVVTWFF